MDHHTYEDEHMHEHEHEHEHEHVHIHEHTHSHPHTHPNGPVAAGEKDKTRILLQYAVDHNAHHADELNTLIQAMRDSGRDEAAALTEQAQDAFRRGSELLHLALEHYGVN